MNDPLKQTGRTTRMLTSAVEAYRRDPARPVYVLVASKDHAALVNRQLDDLWEAMTGKSRFAHHMQVKSVDPEDRGSGFDWNMMRYTTADRRAAYFLDHMLAQKRIDVLVERINRARMQINNLSSSVNV